MTVVLSVIVSVLAGYGFSRFRFPFKNAALRLIILSTIMIPFQSILTPIFLVLTKLGLHNTLTGLVCVYVTLQLPFSIFMMRNAFDAVPREIEEAARIDGANNVTHARAGDAAAGLAGHRHRRAVRLPRRLERVPGRAGAADRPVANSRCRS